MDDQVRDTEPEADRYEDCSACGCHLRWRDGNVCPLCDGINKAVPRLRFIQ